MVNTLYPDAPRIAVGAIVIHENKALLVLRGKPPAQGVWAIPGGSVTLGESLQAAAEREIFEETGLRIKAGEVVYSFDVIERDENDKVKYHYVILDLKAELIDPNQTRVTAADDASDANWFTWAEIDAPKFPVSTLTRNLLQKLMI